ncbi:MAG: serine/threonine protein kinase [Gammaproteobacteria bacterium]|nr:serine/threonine protein kinase [Gammaproteobacteria bacterium]
MKTILKHDVFGTVSRLSASADDIGDTECDALDIHNTDCIIRDYSNARLIWRFLARYLARRERDALSYLNDVNGIPRLIDYNNRRLIRSFLAGAPMHIARPKSSHYFKSAAKLLRTLHRHNVTHNDLAKEPNWLVLDDGNAGLIDFQLARHHRKRSAWFRLSAREDLRHLLKHKCNYRPDLLTNREQAILATPAWPARVWRVTVKPIYLFITRRLMGWADREGAGDRSDIQSKP